MQIVPLSVLTLLIFAQAMFMQAAWFIVSRRARDIYLGDLMNFRTPKSIFSRYYHWRVTRFRNGLIETVVYEIILLASLLAISLALFDFTAFLEASLIVAFVVFLSLVSSVQMALRGREINQRERQLLSMIGTEIDKVGLVRQMVDDLIAQGQMGDGRVWFALYRLAQRPNQVGWAIRDVLIEKAREMDEKFRYSSIEREPTSSEKEPGIE